MQVHVKSGWWLLLWDSTDEDRREKKESKDQTEKTKQSRKQAKSEPISCPNHTIVEGERRK